MRKFIKEFMDFIKRGNVLDMAVGIIVGGAFTAIVTALSNGILKPFINWIIYLCNGGNADALSKIYTVIVPVTDANGVLDLTKSIYIDWGALISAVINFLIIAFVVFTIVKVVNEASQRLNINLIMKESIEKKMKAGAELSKSDKRWIKRMKTYHPELVPVAEEKTEPTSEPAPVPTETERLLQEILTELKKDKGE